jgi:putative DNA primase/helicase
MSEFCNFKNMDPATSLELRNAIKQIIVDRKISDQQLAAELGISTKALENIINGTDDSIESWIAIQGCIVEVLRYYDALPQDDSIDAETPNIVPAICADASIEEDPFAGSAEDIAAKETRERILLFEWADSVLGLNEVDMELEFERATKHFNRSRSFLRQIIKARRNDRKKERENSGKNRSTDSGSDTRYYGEDFRSSSAGVFVRRFECDGATFWEKISTTRMDLDAFTRDQRGENWGTYVAITNRDGGRKKLAIPHALIAADKAAEIAALLASLGVGVIPSKMARQAIVQFLTTEVTDRITSVPQIGWHESTGAWVFVLPEETLTPVGFIGARPVLQTATLQTQHGLDISGTVSDWIEQIATPLEGNSNIALCVGTAFAGPLLKWANEPPGFFHLWGTSKIAKSLAAAVGQSVWGRPKVPGEADAFGASWTATSVGLERYAVLRSDIGGSFDEIGEGQPKMIRAAIYVLANGSTKLRGTQDLGLRPMESFRILGISTGEPTMAAFLTEAGEKVPAGLSVRLVDVPAEVQPESAFETCAVDQIEELGKRFYPLTTQFYGAVGRKWLQHLVDLGPDEIQARLRRQREEWLANPVIDAVRTSATGQVRSVINRFALVAAALRMAIEAGMIPWSMDDADLGVASCLVRWAASRKGRLNLAGEMVSAVEQIRGLLTANLQGRFIHLEVNGAGELEYSNPSDETKRDTLGFVKRGRILVEPTAWRTILCAGFDPEKTARHLKDEGLLATDTGKLQRQHKILRGGSVEKGRFYDLDMKILEDAAGSGPDVEQER